MRSLNETQQTAPEGKPCPGLNGVHCGLPKKPGQGYCDAHRAEYQRNRYTKIAKGEYNPRPYKRVGERCNCCGLPRPNTLVVIKNTSQIPPFCDGCLEIFNAVGRKKMGNLIKVAEFIVAHKEAFAQPDNAYAAEYQRRLESFRRREGYATTAEVEAYVGPIIRNRLDADLDFGVVYYDEATGTIKDASPYSFTFEQIDTMPEGAFDELPDEVKEYYRNKLAASHSDEAKEFAEAYEKKYHNG